MSCLHHWRQFFASGIDLALGLRCSECGECAALGPACDDGPHAAQVAVEIRAAEIADPTYDVSEFAGDAEWAGWCEADTSLVSWDDEADAYQRGYLARVIHLHGHEQRFKDQA
jgi:hypothetical protein